MSTIHVDHPQDGVAVLRFDRPPVNALDIEFCEAIEASVRETVEGGAKALVLTGEGKCFSAGVDTKKASGYSPDELARMVRAINTMYRTIYAAPVPVVSAVNGHALAGGFVFMLASDVCVATDAKCSLGLAEVRAGVPFPAVPLALGRAELDPSTARHLALTGRALSPQEALELRVVDEVVAVDGLVARAVEVAADLATLPAYPKIKAQLRAGTLAEIDATMDTDPMLTEWI